MRLHNLVPHRGLAALHQGNLPHFGVEAGFLVDFEQPLEPHALQQAVDTRLTGIDGGPETKAFAHLQGQLGQQAQGRAVYGLGLALFYQEDLAGALEQQAVLLELDPVLAVSLDQVINQGD